MDDFKLPEAKCAANNNDSEILITSLLPRLPVVSSANYGWKTLQLSCCQEPALAIPEHQPGYHSICINGGKVVRLKQKVDGKAKEIDSVSRDIGIYPAYLAQSFSWNTEAEFWLISLEPKFVSNLGYELFQSNNVELIPQLGSLFDPCVEQLALAVKTTLETDSIASHLYAEAMANALAVHLLSRYSNCSRSVRVSKAKLSQQQLSRVVDYIYSNLDREISLAQLAAIVNLSEFHFGRLFKQTTGIAPHQYHLQCRIDRAKQLLLQGMAIARVAQTVGFSSQGHLNYHFKRRVGLTPKQFLQ